ncbi:Uncharacterised protein [Mycobacterium tuberculosis]|nr:Uncharacterised protein [Mycobacterium tuberculosis]
MDRSGGVGGDEFQVDLAPGQQQRVTVAVAGVDNAGNDFSLGGGFQPHVDKARPGHLRRGDTVDLCQCLGKPSGQLTRVGADFLGELHRQVTGIVAVLGNARAFHRDHLRQRGGIEAALGQHRGRGRFEQLSQVSGGHERPSYGLRWLGFESVAVVSG